MRASLPQRSIKVLTGLCLFVVVTHGLLDRVAAAAQIRSAQALVKRNCPYPHSKTTELNLHRILAKHFGWLQDQLYVGKKAGDDYLDRVYPGWHNDARPHAQAILLNADLRCEDLTGANLSGANLRGALLQQANLSGASLQDANIDGADLTHADFSGANLRGTHVSGARLAFATLTDAIYAPAYEPPNSYVSGIKGLDTVHVLPDEEVGLVKLRQLLQDDGLTDLERATTYSIERSVTTQQFEYSPTFLRDVLSHLGYIDEGEVQLITSLRGKGYVENAGKFSWLGGLLRILGLDITTKYGMEPTLALLQIIFWWSIFTVVYMLALIYGTKNDWNASGIYQVFPELRIEASGAKPPLETVPRVIRVPSTNWRAAIGWAAYFSLLSAVNIGFKEFTPGDWISRLQGRDYALQAVGWVRTVAGVQALLSVYLLAMWVLTQFGRPFG